MIRIHPLLDQPSVPLCFIRYIIAHEMLHALLGIKTTPSGRQRLHTPEFKQQEKSIPDYAPAMIWYNNPANLKQLLSTLKK